MIDIKRLTKKKIVLVTGSTRGIGFAIAKRFADYGYFVVLNGRERHALNLATAEIEKTGIPCAGACGDVGDPKFVKGLFISLEKIAAEYGYEHPIDILVNSAGISKLGLIQDMTDDDWNEIVRSNLTGVFNTCRAAVPRMVKAQSGKIINISSVWGCVGASCEVAYSATKGGVNALTKALAKELAPSGISVNALALGAIDTRMNSFMDAEEKKNLLEEIPAGRMGTPDEVADLVLKLARTGAYLTGEVIRFDGAWI